MCWIHFGGGGQGEGEKERPICEVACEEKSGHVSG